MDWDQILFRKIHHFFKGLTGDKEDPQRLERRVELKPLIDRLSLLARAITGAPVRISPAETEGGLCLSVFLLPPACDAFSTEELNLHYYLYRVCFLASQWRLKVQGVLSPDLHGRQALPQEQIDLVEKDLRARWPGLHEIMDALWSEVKRAEAQLQDVEEHDDEDDDEDDHRPHHQPTTRLMTGFWLEHLKESLGAVETPVHKGLPEKDKDDKIQTQKDAPVKEEIELLTVDDKSIQDYTLLHNFEKIETLDEFRGRWRQLDGEDELDEHSEALDDLDLRQVVRTDVPTHSVLKTEFLLRGGIPESADNQDDAPHILYPEWDFKSKRQKPDHCKVFLHRSLGESPQYVRDAMLDHKKTLNELRRQLARFHNEREQRKRQRHGEQPDLDAVIDSYASLCAGRSPDDRLYLSKRPRRRDLSILILMDMSLSTDGYSDGRRILDVEKQSVLIFSQLLHEQGEHFQVDAFSSRTRNRCQYFSLKNFSETWPSASKRVGGLRPVGYTRIGPAIRHATALLERQPAAKKWLLILSDGKPNDYDRYEGNYGIQDVRQAIREAQTKHVSTYALAIEREAKHYLPLMLGPSNYRILPHPQALPEALLYFYMRLQ